MKIEIEGKKIKVNIMGEFEVEENTYAACSYEDNEDNHKIVLLQIEKRDGVYYPDEIPEENVEKVVNYFQEIKDKLMEGKDE